MNSIRSCNIVKNVPKIANFLDHMPLEETVLEVLELLFWGNELLKKRHGAYQKNVYKLLNIKLFNTH